MKKKIPGAICILLTVYSASGCSSDGFYERLNRAVTVRSDIETDESYINYRNDLASGNILGGYYYDENSPVVLKNDDSSSHSGKARISISSNNRLNVHYYSDSGLEYEITDVYGDFIYMGSGSTIYAVPEMSAGNTSGYSFSEFRVYEIRNGIKTAVPSVYTSDSHLVYTVPEQCSDLEIVIEPVGCYGKSSVTLSDYYVSDTFQQIKTDSIWKINGTEYPAGKAETDSLGSYTVSCEFDSDKYFFVSSEPTYYYQDDSKVLFSRVTASDDISEYKVEIHPYISTVIKSDSRTSVEINGVQVSSFGKGEEISLDKLKFGDTIVISCSKKDTLEYDTDVLSMVKADDIFSKYTFKVKEPSDDFTFDPSEYRFEHGTIEFSYLGNVIDSKISLSAGRQIEYTAVSADTGYWLPDGDNVITVSEDPSETKKAIESIRFFEKKLVTVNFPQPEAGGSVLYKKGDRTINSESEKMFSGTRITMKYTAWNGWELNPVTDTFIVSDESETQTVDFSGTDINGIFSESTEHRPHLTVIADKQVGSDISFSIKTSDVSQTGLKWDKKNNTLLDTDTGTSAGISISASGTKQNKDQALKILIEKTDQNKNKYTEIFYLDELPAEKTAEIYTNSQMKSSDIYYTDISVKIYSVDKLIYQPEIFENAKVTLKYTDTDSKSVLFSGQITDKDRQVLVMVTPEEHYYLSGEEIKDNKYQKKMKYSEFLANADKINKSCLRKKICTVDLKTSDDYGKVVYTLNGTQVSGVTEVREDDELIMTYTLENKDYIIYKDFLSAMHDLLSNSPYEKSEVITVSAELDGASITREDYISVQKKEK